MENIHIVFQQEGDFREGSLILVDKPLHWTSFDVVNKIRWCLRPVYGKSLKVGHAGTLDPLATGLVMICTGKWTKQIDSYMGQEKEYVATLQLGATTPSYDLETQINATFPYEHITRELFEDRLKQFIGTIQQAPPIFSAVRIDGVRAYKKARKGSDAEMPTREVFIRELEIVHFEPPRVDVRVVCSKGTYIRSLANDLGKACQSGAHLSGLVRTRSGENRLENANQMDSLVEYLKDWSNCNKTNNTDIK